MQHSDNVIDTKLLPALLDQHSLSRHERELLSVPTRLGGLGIPIFSNICVEENVNSKTISQYLSSNIVLQNHTPAPGRGDCIQDQRREIANQREERYKSLLDNLRSNMSEEQLRANDLAQQKGSSFWLTALPLADEGYVLTKRDVLWRDLPALPVAVEAPSILLCLWQVIHCRSCLVVSHGRLYQLKT